jgi:N-acetylmuramoyl-L-alanine amidase
MRSISLIVIHCSATPNGVAVSPEQISAWQRERGFQRDVAAAQKFRPNLPHIGYHRLVLADGGTWTGLDLDEVGEHDSPSSVSVCMVGTSAFFLEQWRGLTRSLCALAATLLERGCGPRAAAEHRASWARPDPREAIALLTGMGISVVGHRDVPDCSKPRLRVCPGFEVRTWLDHGMEPDPVHVLDDHPAITQADPIGRAMSAMRYGVN